VSSLRRALIALGVLAFLAGIGSAALVLTSDHATVRGLGAALIVAAGWSFAGTGLYAWDRRPGNSIGPLMTAIGFTWFFQALSAAGDSVVFAIGILGASLPYAILVHLLVAFPSGRLQGRFQHVVVGAAYLTTTVLQLAWALFTDPTKQSDCQGCPENPVLIAGHEGIAEVINVFQVSLACFAIASTVAIVFLRWRRSTPAQRRVLTPVVLTGGVAFTILLAQLIVSELDLPGAVEDSAYGVSIVIFASLPFAFLLGLLRSRIGRAEEMTTALSAENEQLTAELRAKVEELRASRARIVEAGYAERRRVERDLHDGAQQRLMALTMNLRLARDKLSEDPAATAELLDEAMEELAAATAELRELARGIHPAVLTDRGLAAALGGLAERSPVPVEVVETPSERLPAPIESTTYFVVAEALTNVARYAEASGASVRVGRANGVVEIEVRDDGVGGGALDTGTGLRGLADRVAALEGSFTVRSDPGEGTVVEARIPCE
jgi:signal transduction histidine kinase